MNVSWKLIGSNLLTGLRQGLISPSKNEHYQLLPQYPRARCVKPINFFLFNATQAIFEV